MAPRSFNGNLFSKSPFEASPSKAGSLAETQRDEKSLNNSPFTESARIATHGSAQSPRSETGRLSEKRPSLTSPRDRQRLRERNAAERARVERMLAGAPPPTERRHGRRAGVARTRAGTAAPALPPSERTLLSLRAVPEPGCPVCASTKTVTDEVFHGGTLRLSECLHCEHRWTVRPRGRWAELGAAMARGRSRGAPRGGPGIASGTVSQSASQDLTAGSATPVLRSA